MVKILSSLSRRCMFGLLIISDEYRLIMKAHNLILNYFSRVVYEGVWNSFVVFKFIKRDYGLWILRKRWLIFTTETQCFAVASSWTFEEWIEKLRRSWRVFKARSSFNAKKLIASKKESCIKLKHHSIFSVLILLSFVFIIKFFKTLIRQWFSRDVFP